MGKLRYLPQAPKDWLELYILPADDLLFATEEIRYPRSRECPFANTLTDIRNGFKHKPWTPLRVRLDRLSDNKYKVVRRGLDQQDAWVFVSYGIETPLRFFSIDSDRHHKKGETHSQFQAIEEKFWEQVREVENLGLHGAWTTTPGQSDSALSQSALFQGLNYNIYLDREITVRELRELQVKLERRLGWTLETNVSQLTKDGRYVYNYRFPGQFNVQFAHVDIDNGFIQPRTSNFREFCEALEKRHITNWDTLCEVANDVPANDAPFLSIPAAPVAIPKQRQRPKRPAHVELDVQRLRQFPCTFKAFTDSGLGSCLAHKYHGEQDRFDDALQEFVILFPKMRPVTSKTCTDGELLKTTGRRWLGWYWKTFNTTSKGKFKHFARDTADIARMEYCKGITAKQVINHLGIKSVSKRRKLHTFMSLIGRYRGRVSVKALYDDDAASFSKDAWFSFIRKMRNVFTILDTHSQEEHKCRQWGLTRELAQQLLGVKKREIVDGEASPVTECDPWFSPILLPSSVIAGLLCPDCDDIAIPA